MLGRERPRVVLDGVFLALLLASAETTVGILSSFELSGVAAVVLCLAAAASPSVLKITVFFGVECKMYKFPFILSKLML